MVNLANVSELNGFLADKSYIDGFEPSSADTAAFAEIKKAPDASQFPHASRWFHHISSFTEEERKAFHAGHSPAATSTSTTAKKDEDDIDLFGDDEDDEEYEKQLLERRKAAEEAKGKKDKPAVVAKSSLLIDVKPWDDETPMDKLEESVRSIVMDGLLWGASKLVPVGYGIKKLQINAVVVDDLVSVDDLEEKITAFEDYVQSMDVAAFNKI